MVRKGMRFIASIGVVCIVGCSGEPGVVKVPDSAKTSTASNGGSTRTATGGSSEVASRSSRPTPAVANAEPPKPAVKLKPASELKEPTDLPNPATEMKVPKSAFAAYAEIRPGAFVEYETTGAGVSRTEFFDVADHAVVYITTTSFKIEGKEQVNKAGVKMLFTEPDPKPPEAKKTEPGDDKTKAETKPSDRKFKIGDEEIVAENVVEAFADGKVVSRSWTSKKIPWMGTLATEDGEGKPLLKLIRYSRGK